MGPVCIAHVPTLMLYWNVDDVFILGAESCGMLSQKAIGPDIAENVRGAGVSFTQTPGHAYPEIESILELN